MDNFWLIGQILKGQEFCSGAMLISDGEVKKIAPQPDEKAPHLLYPNSYILPGLIELHIHGAKGCDFADGSRQGNQKIANFLSRQGISGYVAAIVSSPHKETLRAIETLAENRPRGPKLLAILLEGPFIASKKRGAHRIECLQKPNIARAKEYIRLIPEDIQPIILVAPELPGALPFIKELKKLGVIVALGHSAADYETTQKALKAGATYGIHLWNAMAPLNHRQPGIVGALLTSEEAYVEVIGDMLHLHRAIVKLTIKAKSPQRVALVTDTTGPAGLPKGIHFWNGQEVTVTSKDIRLADSTLAGSNITNDQLLRSILSLGQSLTETVQMRSAVPAKIIGPKAKAWGRLQVGKEANISVLDKKMKTLLTVAQGKVIYPSSRTRLTALFKS